MTVTKTIITIPIGPCMLDFNGDTENITIRNVIEKKEEEPDDLCKDCKPWELPLCNKCTGV